MRKTQKRIGVLAFHGDVIEHKNATEQALKKLRLLGKIIEVRDTKTAEQLDALIIPGGESTVLYELSERAGIVEKLKKIPYIFGTCAGAILLSKHIKNAAPGQKTLALMDITIDRNAYGRQTESFEAVIKGQLGEMPGIFIRAPRIQKIGVGVKKLAYNSKEVVACEQRVKKQYLLAACFHPELTTTIFHEYFLKKIFGKN